MTMCRNFKKFKNLVLTNLIVLSGLTISNLFITNIYTQAKRIGGNRDSHGCLTGAGYSWCEIGNSCVRPWELATCFSDNLQDKDRFTDFVNTNALDADGNPNRAIATTMLCDPSNSFWNDVSADTVQICFPNNTDADLIYGTVNVDGPAAVTYEDLDFIPPTPDSGFGDTGNGRRTWGVTF